MYRIYRLGRMLRIKALFSTTWQHGILGKISHLCSAFLLRPCFIHESACLNSMGHATFIKISRLTASCCRAGMYFLCLVTVYPAFQVPSLVPHRSGNLQSSETTSARFYLKPFQSTVGALFAEASTSSGLGQLREDKLEKSATEVCVDNGRNFHSLFLTSLDLSAVPNTPEGSTPPVQHGILRAVQRERWNLLHQTSPLGYSLVYNLLTLRPSTPPGSPKPRLLPPREKQPAEADPNKKPAPASAERKFSDERESLFEEYPSASRRDGGMGTSPTSERKASDSSERGLRKLTPTAAAYGLDHRHVRRLGTVAMKSGDGDDFKGLDIDDDDLSKLPAKPDDPEGSFPPAPPRNRPIHPTPPQQWPLALKDAVFVYVPFLGGYLTLVIMGAIFLVLAIPLLLVLLCTPRTRWASTGGFVNLFCIPGAFRPAEIDTITEQGPKLRPGEISSESPTAQADATILGKGTGTLCLSEEAVTQDSAGLKPGGGADLAQEEQDALTEGGAVNSHRAEGTITEATHITEASCPWIGQKLGLAILVLLLLAVLTSVSVGFAYTAQMGQTLQAAQCAVSAAIAQVFNGEPVARQRVTSALSQRWPTPLAVPEDPQRKDDYVPGSFEYIAVVENMLQASGLPQKHSKHLVQVFGTGKGSPPRPKTSSGSGVDRRLAALQNFDPFCSLPTRRLAAESEIGDLDVDSDDEKEDAFRDFSGSATQAVLSTPAHLPSKEGTPVGFVSSLYDSLGSSPGEKSQDAAVLPGGGDVPGGGTRKSTMDLSFSAGASKTNVDDDGGTEKSSEEKLPLDDGKNSPDHPYPVTPVSEDSRVTSGFAGIRPLLEMARRIEKITVTESPESISSVAAKSLAKGLALEHLLMSLYDHLSAIEELIEGDWVPRGQVPPFGHSCLAQTTVMPFLNEIIALLPSGRKTVNDLRHVAHQGISQVIAKEEEAYKKLEPVMSPDIDEGIKSTSQAVFEIGDLITAHRSRTIPAILYTIGALLMALLVGSILYLMFLNRQHAKTWQTGTISPRLAGFFWWGLYLAAAAAVLFGALLLTFGVGMMDACIFTAAIIQEPNELAKILANEPAKDWLDGKLATVISACAGRAEDRDLSFLFNAKSVHDELEKAVKDARKHIKRKDGDDISDLIAVIALVLELAHEHAGLYYFNSNVRASPETSMRAAYYSGLQDETVEFYSIFNVERADFLGPEGIERNDLLPISPQTTKQGMVRFYRRLAGRPAVDDLLMVIDGGKLPLEDRVKAARRLLDNGHPKGKFLLYGLNDLQTAIQPFFFEALVPSENGGYDVDDPFLVDNSGTTALRKTQDYLATLPPNKRIPLGNALELARRKTMMRPGKTFTCLMRQGYMAEDLRHADRRKIELAAEKFRAYFPDDEPDPYGAFDWMQDTKKFEIRLFGTGKFRQLYNCPYEENTALVRDEADQAFFAVASIYGRVQKMIGEVEAIALDRADAAAKSVELLMQNVDCTEVYRSVITSQHLICRDVTERIGGLGITWLFTALLAIALFVISLAVWRYLTERQSKRRVAEEARRAALLAAEKAAEDARREEEERIAAEEVAEAAAAASAARAEARSRQISAAALNRQRTSVQRAQSITTPRWQIQASSLSGASGVRERLAAIDQSDFVEDSMWADTPVEYH